MIYLMGETISLVHDQSTYFIVRSRVMQYLRQPWLTNSLCGKCIFSHPSRTESFSLEIKFHDSKRKRNIEKHTGNFLFDHLQLLKRLELKLRLQIPWLDNTFIWVNVETWIIVSKFLSFEINVKREKNIIIMIILYIQDIFISYRSWYIKIWFIYLLSYISNFRIQIELYLFLPRFV